MEDHAYTYEVESEVLRVLDDDVKLALQRELILLVQNQPFLYDKKMDGHADKDLVANAWDSIGLSLSKPMTGEDACKEFYKLRQRFGKEKRKVRRGKPRPGVGSAYVPNWVLFNDLEFLSDHIQARIRSSINTTNSSLQTAAQFVPRIVRVRGIIPGTCTPRPELATASPDKPVSDPGPSRFKIKVAPPSTDSPTSSRSIHDDVESASGSMENDPIGNINFSTMEEPSDNSSGPTRVMNVAGTEPLYKKRRQESGSFSRSVQEYSKQIKELAVSVSAALEKASGDTKRSSGPAVWDNFPPHVQAMLTSLGFAFLRICEEDHLSCLIDILNIINTKYCKNHSE